MIKGIDLFIGVKAEQTLRDAVRTEAEANEDASGTPELCPASQKDWIAGERIGESVKFGDIGKKKLLIIKNLIDLKSHQRIRHENIKVFAVRPPVPVFKDPQPEEETVDDTLEESIEQPTVVTCPICGVDVHKYNIQYDPWGKMVGCYLCRGEKTNKP